MKEGEIACKSPDTEIDPKSINPWEEGPIQAKDDWSELKRLSLYVELQRSNKKNCLSLLTGNS